MEFAEIGIFSASHIEIVELVCEALFLIIEKSCIVVCKDAVS